MHQTQDVAPVRPSVLEPGAQGEQRSPAEAEKESAAQRLHVPFEKPLLTAATCEPGAHVAQELAPVPETPAL